MNSEKLIQRAHVNNEMLEDIFRSEGWIYGLGEISKHEHLVDERATSVYPQDVVDAIRMEGATRDRTSWLWQHPTRNRSTNPCCGHAPTMLQ